MTELDKVKERLGKGCSIDEITGCWNWLSDMRFYYEGAYDKVYRVSYILYKGKILGGHSVERKCKNTRCINPDHLELVDNGGKSGSPYIRSDFNYLLNRIVIDCELQNKVAAYDLLIDTILYRIGTERMLGYVIGHVRDLK